jgi:hypothetical protein
MSKQASNSQPQLRAVVMPLFPTLGSIQEVVDFSESKLPITDKNELFSLLMTMQNTLLKEVNMK